MCGCRLRTLAAVVVMKIKLIVVATPAARHEESGGLVVTDREIGVITDRLGGKSATQHFRVARTLSNADALHDAAIAPLIDALLSRRLQTEEAAIFTLGNAQSCEAVLVGSCLRCLLNGLASSPRELVASALAVHAADANTTPLSREVVTDLLQPVSAGHRSSASASEVKLTSATRGAQLLLAAADARPPRACVLLRLVARMPRDKLGGGANGHTDPRLHLVLLPPSESLASGPAAVSFSFLAGALAALSGGDHAGVPPPRSSKLMLLLRDLLRPAPPVPAASSPSSASAASASAWSAAASAATPAQFLCVACVSQARDASDHALATLKLASRLCAADQTQARHPAVAAWRAAVPSTLAGASSVAAQAAAVRQTAAHAATPAIEPTPVHPATQPWEVEGYEASLWAPSAVSGVANAFVAQSVRQRSLTRSCRRLSDSDGTVASDYDAANEVAVAVNVAVAEAKRAVSRSPPPLVEPVPRGAGSNGQLKVPAPTAPETSGSSRACSSSSNSHGGGHGREGTTAAADSTHANGHARPQSSVNGHARPQSAPQTAVDAMHGLRLSDPRLSQTASQQAAGRGMVWDQAATEEVAERSAVVAMAVADQAATEEVAERSAAAAMAVATDAATSPPSKLSPRSPTAPNGSGSLENAIQSATPRSALLETVKAREAALVVLEEMLSRREEAVAARESHHTAVDDIEFAAAELASRDASVSEREKAVAEAEARVLESDTSRKAANAAREAGIDAREADLRSREAALSDAEAAQRESEGVLTTKLEDATLQVSATSHFHDLSQASVTFPNLP